MPDTLTCARCHHTWRPRMERLPLRCPKCGTLKWSAPRPDAAHATGGQP